MTLMMAMTFGIQKWDDWIYDIPSQGGLFSFLFGTADQSDVDSLKADVKQ